MQETIDATGSRLVPVVQDAPAQKGLSQEVLAQEGLDESAMAARSTRRLALSERGMVSAEWAVGIIAAIAIAGVLLSVVTNGAVEEAILGFILQVIRSFAGGLR